MIGGMKPAKLIKHVRIDKRSVTRTGLKYPDGITMT